MKSWKTTVLGILQILVVVVAALVGEEGLLSPKVLTWALPIQAVLIALQGFFTRDNDVTSEKAGAK